MTDQPRPIRKSLLPCTPPAEYEFSTVLTSRPDGHSGVMLLPGDIGSVVVRRTVSYGDWEPVRPTRWAEEEPSDRSTAAAIDATTAKTQPTPAPASLRDHYAAAIVRGGACVDLAAATDAVLAVRDGELEKLRKRMDEYRESRRRWMDAANRDRQAALDADARARKAEAAIEAAITALHDLPYEHAKPILAALDRTEQQ